MYVNYNQCIDLYVHGNKARNALYEIMKIMSQSEKICPIPHQRLNFKFLPKPGFGHMLA